MSIIFVTNKITSSHIIISQGRKYQLRYQVKWKRILCIDNNLSGRNILWKFYTSKLPSKSQPIDTNKREIYSKSWDMCEKSQCSKITMAFTYIKRLKKRQITLRCDCFILSNFQHCQLKITLTFNFSWITFRNLKQESPAFLSTFNLDPICVCHLQFYISKWHMCNFKFWT